MDSKLLLSMFRTMVAIRRFEERSIELYQQGHIHGTIHPYIGQDAIAAGVCAALFVFASPSAGIDASSAYIDIATAAIAFTLFYWLVRRMDVVNTMLIALVTPVVAVVLGMIVLHERFNWRLFAGAACIISGIGFIVLRKRQKTVAIDEEEPEMMAVG